MFPRLLLLFTLLPFTELALLVWLGQHVGLVPTVALVLITGAVGAALARWQGLATLRRFQATLGRGELPHKELLEGVLILLAGAVLLTPGLITDTVGFSLLAPPIRRRVAAWLSTKLGPPKVILHGERQHGERRHGERQHDEWQHSGRRRVDDPDVIEADFSVHQDE